MFRLIRRNLKLIFLLDLLNLEIWQRWDHSEYEELQESCFIWLSHQVSYHLSTHTSMLGLHG